MGDLFAGARLAIWGSMLSVLLSIIFLKDRNNNSEGTEGNKTNSDWQQKVHQKQQSFLQSIHNTISYLKHPTIGPLLFIKLLNGVSSSAFTTVLPLVLVNKLHLNTSQLGYFMSASFDTNKTALQSDLSEKSSLSVPISTRFHPCALISVLV